MATITNLFGTGKNPGGRVTVIRVTGDASPGYPTGGYTLPAGLINGVAFYGVASTDVSSVRLWYWNNQTQALMAFDAFRTQEGNGTDCAADTITLIGVVV